MHDECVVGVYDSLEKAERGVHILRLAGFPTDQISVASPSAKTALDPEALRNLKLGDDSIRDAALGAGLGSLLGVLAGVAAMAVSGLGVVFLAGPIGGGIFGATLGGYLGTFFGWGIHNEHLRHYEKCVLEGNSLVIASGSPEQVKTAETVLKESECVELKHHARDSEDSKEIDDTEESLRA